MRKPVQREIRKQATVTGCQRTTISSEARRRNWTEVFAMQDFPTPNKRSVVVTGAIGNLGVAVARAFAAEGARVALVDHAQPPVALSSEFGKPHCVLGGVDLTRVASAAFAMETVRTT